MHITESTLSDALTNTIVEDTWNKERTHADLRSFVENRLMRTAEETDS